MYKLVDRFKKNAENFFEESSAKPSIENSKRGKNKTKVFIIFKDAKNKTFFKAVVTNIKTVIKSKFF